MPRKLNVTLGTGSPTPPPPPTDRFYGDPGVGNMYMGVSPQVSSLATHESEMNASLALVRTYFSGDTLNMSTISGIVNGGRIPWINFLIGSRTWAQVADGSSNSWIDGIGTQIASFAPTPVWWTCQHEPENDPNAGGSTTFGAQGNPQLATDYRNGLRVMIPRISAIAANAVNSAVNYMTPSTFNPGGTNHRDWRWWYPDFHGDPLSGDPLNPDPSDFYINGNPLSVVQLIGLDFYHGWDLPDGMGKWNTTNAPNVWNVRIAPKTAFLNKPYAIGEWATMAAQDGLTFDPGPSLTLAQYNTQYANGQITFYQSTTNTWLDDYYTSALANNCVGMAYWDQHVDTNVVSENPLANCDPLKHRWTKLGELARRSTSVLWTP